MLRGFLAALLSPLAAALARYARWIDDMEYESGIWYPYHWMD